AIGGDGVIFQHGLSHALALAHDAAFVERWSDRWYAHGGLAVVSETLTRQDAERPSFSRAMVYGRVRPAPGPAWDCGICRADRTGPPGRGTRRAWDSARARQARASRRPWPNAAGNRTRPGPPPPRRWPRWYAPIPGAR